MIEIIADFMDGTKRTLITLHHRKGRLYIHINDKTRPNELLQKDIYIDLFKIKKELEENIKEILS